MLTAMLRVEPSTVCQLPTNDSRVTSPVGARASRSRSVPRWPAPPADVGAAAGGVGGRLPEKLIPTMIATTMRIVAVTAMPMASPGPRRRPRRRGLRRGCGLGRQPHELLGVPQRLLLWLLLLVGRGRGGAIRAVRPPSITSVPCDPPTTCVAATSACSPERVASGSVCSGSIACTGGGSQPSDDVPSESASTAAPGWAGGSDPSPAPRRRSPAAAWAPRRAAAGGSRIAPTIVAAEPSPNG